MPRYQDAYVPPPPAVGGGGAPLSGLCLLCRGIRTLLKQPEAVPPPPVVGGCC
ncbi:MAG: hypothetical protein LBD24_05185 [Spirochaetaceae bacterium]|nr:hypothetical protein [Spirochaetaceae bacterium]